MEIAWRIGTELENNELKVLVILAKAAFCSILPKIGSFNER
jgi:hypothetical protein